MPRGMQQCRRQRRWWGRPRRTWIHWVLTHGLRTYGSPWRLQDMGPWQEMDEETINCRKAKVLSGVTHWSNRSRQNVTWSNLAADNPVKSATIFWHAINANDATRRQRARPDKVCPSFTKSGERKSTKITHRQHPDQGRLLGSCSRTTGRFADWPEILGVLQNSFPSVPLHVSFF